MRDQAKRAVSGGTTIAAFLFSALASAQASEPAGWFLQLGVANVGFAESAEISLGGVPVEGSDASVTSNQSPVLAGGYQFSNGFSALAIVGPSPTTRIDGLGTLAGVDVGKVTYGPLILAVDYRVPTSGPFKPFFGLGLNYTLISNVRDGRDIKRLEADDAYGPTIRLGFDYMFSKRNGVFLSANKVFASTESTGIAPAFGNAPVEADIDLNPLIMHVGWIHRF